MTSYPWAYCLDESQFEKLFRIICKIPGLKDFLSHNPGSDLRCLLYSYRSKIIENGTLSPGISINIDVLISRYDIYKKEYDAIKNNDTIQDFELDAVLTWKSKPLWAENMSIEEIDYLDHFIPQVEGLSSYLYKNKNIRNLYDLIVYFQMRLNASGENTSHTDFVLETIKERFYRIMDDHYDAIHYVNHSHEIDDYEFIKNFDEEAKQTFYITNLESNICGDFTNKYIKFSNPYVASEIFLRYFKADKINIALSLAHQAFKYIFAAPNIYWHNKESVYGSVNILYIILQALDIQGLEALNQMNPKLARCLTESLYLLLSRTIYWSDKETIKNEIYDDGLLPINIQHKLRAYRLRSNLVESFLIEMFSGYDKRSIDSMMISDLVMAHTLAKTTQIVGDNSLFMRDAINIFEPYSINNGDMRKLSLEGFELSDEISKNIFKNYKEGKYSLTEHEISELVSFIRLHLKTTKKEAKDKSLPIPYLIKDNYSPVFKTDSDIIREYLIANDIKCFYHFTEISKLDSIIKSGGLLSYRRCLDEGIVLPIREDMAFSRDIDASLGLEDYARLSFSNCLPKIKTRQKKGAKLVMLKINPEVALFEETIFTNIEATSPGMQFGSTSDFLKKVNIPATKKITSPEDVDYLESQAEILIKGMIPLKYILNIDNPIQLN